MRRALLAALITVTLAGCSPASPGPARQQGGGTVWLCRPGSANDPCAFPFSATAVGPSGQQSPAVLPGLPSTATAHRFNCFYVYPTVSSQTTTNSDLQVTKDERDAALGQASPFSSVCNVWAPMYRSATLSTVAKALQGNAAAVSQGFQVAYSSLSAAWDDFIAHDDAGLPVILIGHSQGSAMIIRLIHDQIDFEPNVLSRLVVAIIPGGNLQVPSGATEGATFAHVPVCTSAAQAGCAIAWSSFPAQPAAQADFGRAGVGVSLLDGEPSVAGQQVACSNPAGETVAAGALEPYFVTITQSRLANPPTTNWVTYPGLYTARCMSGGGATWLQVDHRSDDRPVVSEPLGPGWGYHNDDINLAIGNLLQDVATKERSWSQAHPGGA
jgi:hypothetical protein